MAKLFTLDLGLVVTRLVTGQDEGCSHYVQLLMR